jgi:hypothetical protein
MVQISSSSDAPRRLKKKPSVINILAPFVFIVLLIASLAIYVTFRFSNVRAASLYKRRVLMAAERPSNDGLRAALSPLLPARKMMPRCCCYLRRHFAGTEAHSSLLSNSISSRLALAKSLG